MMRCTGDTNFARDAYLRAQRIWRGRVSRKTLANSSQDARSHTPFTSGRDPRPLGDILSFAADDMGWSAEIDEAKVIAQWSEIVGETIAPHTSVVEIRDHILIVQCDSTAWATELRRMRAEILSRIMSEFSRADIEDLRFLAPGAPTWRHGARVVRGRGPRDTYG